MNIYVLLVLLILVFLWTWLRTHLVASSYGFFMYYNHTHTQSRECITFVISSGGIGNQRGTIRNAIQIAQETNACLILGKFRSGISIPSLISFPDDLCILQTPKHCSKIHHYSESRIFKVAAPLTEWKPQDRTYTPRLGNTPFIEEHTQRFLKHYDLHQQEFVCIHLRKPEPHYRGNMRRTITKDFAHTFLEKLPNQTKILLLSSGYEPDLIELVEKQSKDRFQIIKPVKLLDSHRHGLYDPLDTLEASIQIAACAKASQFLGRKESTFSREIAMMSMKNNISVY